MIGVLLKYNSKCYINKATEKANTMSTWILRTFETLWCSLYGRHLFYQYLILWKTLVLPILDYCSQPWNMAWTWHVDKFHTGIPSKY